MVLLWKPCWRAKSNPGHEVFGGEASVALHSSSERYTKWPFHHTGGERKNTARICWSQPVFIPVDQSTSLMLGLRQVKRQYGEALMNVGYARVSTVDQTLVLQEDALKQADCAIIYRDTVSGAKAERPGLQKALDYVRAGDTLIAWRLDRLGRSAFAPDRDGGRGWRTGGSASKASPRALTRRPPAANGSFTCLPRWRSSSAISSASAPRPGWWRRGHGDARAGVPACGWTPNRCRRLCSCMKASRLQ